MLKLLRNICFAFVALAPCGAHADKMVNVEYIHKLIEQRWGIVIPYSPKLSTPKVAANMKYLLTLVDMTNKRINGTATTDYGNGEFATMVAADTVAANTAITKLARIKPKFTITTTPDTSEFTFRMSAKGRFMVDWGDNTATEIVRTDTKNTTYTHEYKKPGEYKIKMTGLATGYNTGYVAAVRFGAADWATEVNKTLAKIEGSLGAIFPTIGDGDGPGQQPAFIGTFFRCEKLAGTIPENIFAGIHGAPRINMFSTTFYECHNITGAIPEKLFGDLSGPPAEGMFSSTFYWDTKLTGEIPENLFVGIKGQPAPSMFNNTFGGCSGLTGEIPEKLFAGIKGAPAKSMFSQLFFYCGGLSGPIPAKLFAGISGEPASGMYYSTFHNCRRLTSIPAGLFGDIYGAPAPNMYSSTFGLCTGLSGEIPENLFGKLSGPAAEGMFKYTFWLAHSLTGPSAKIDGKYLYEIWPDATANQVGGCYQDASKLSDHATIPDIWKKPIPTEEQQNTTDGN